MIHGKAAASDQVQGRVKNPSGPEATSPPDMPRYINATDPNKNCKTNTIVNKDKVDSPSHNCRVATAANA